MITKDDTLVAKDDMEKDAPNEQKWLLNSQKRIESNVCNQYVH